METAIKRTALNDVHRKLKAKLVEFVGWEMPVEFSGLVDEHVNVRTRAGLFDVSHMGEIFVSGPDAIRFLQKVLSNNPAKLKHWQIQYTGLMTDKGTFVDDMLCHRFNDDSFFLCVNASNKDKDFDWMKDRSAGFNCSVEDRSPQYSQIAIQGPLSESILRAYTNVDLSKIRYYWFTEGEVLGEKAVISRTGYTGEDGFEIYVRWDAGGPMFERLLEDNVGCGLKPAGLGARDTLRLEAGMHLYGNDIDDTTTVLEAGLEWIVSWDKGPFDGRDVLAAQKERGLSRKLVGFEMVDRGIARHGYPIAKDGKTVGSVTSGTHSPWFKKAIGLGYVPLDLTPDGTELDVLIREKPCRARVVPTPFYKRSK
ncbi:MAG: glycine cleavage system aminomethyltransferase GcvT [Acidobacteriota bacterium]